jgi:hypothetical protein
MPAISTIDYDGKVSDFLINGKSFLDHLAKHENVERGRHVPAVLSQHNACSRLLGNSDPDLVGGYVALYVCSHCGGYDGGCIGAKIIVENDLVIWRGLGYYSDIENDIHAPFNKVREFIFSKENYENLVNQLKIYEPSKIA